MRGLHKSIYGVCLAFVFTLTNSAWAALPVELEVAMEQGAPLTAPQEWAKRLGEMDLASVRLRGLRGGDEPAVEQLGTPASPRFRVLAILTSGDELVVPGKKFRARDREKLKAYFAALPAAQAESANPHGRFGLTEPEFRRAYEPLSRPTGFSTVGLRYQEALARLESDLSLPIASWRKPAALESKIVDAELQHLSRGTALAYLLRQLELGFTPVASGGGVELRIARPVLDRESWPVGWKLTDSPRTVAPALYEFMPIEIQGASAAKTLNAFAPNLQVPLLMDHWQLERREIDLDVITITIPAKRTYLKSALERVLSQARLSGELRVDEAGKPFYWITQFGEGSPRAVE